jgi:hypothetical protein
MNRRPALALTLALASTAALAPAAAASPAGIPFSAVVHTTFDAKPDAFESTLPGCRRGTVTDVSPMPRYTPWGGVFSGTKVFACKGGSGGFAVALQARFGADGSTGTWTISDGWGDYADLAGSGSLSGVPVDGGIDDHYVGTLR